MAAPLRAPFQFSLRELLLVITACAALLTVVLQNARQFLHQNGSGLIETFDLKATAIEAAAKHGITIKAGSGGGSRTGTSSSPTGCDVETSCHMKIRLEDRVTFFKGIQERIKEKLEEAGCKEDGGGTGSHSFFWRFHSQSLQGAVKAEMLVDPANPDYVHINYFAVEFRK